MANPTSYAAPLANSVQQATEQALKAFAQAASQVQRGYLSTRHQQAPYHAYTIEAFYHWNEGTMLIPVAQQSGTDYRANPVSRPQAMVVNTSAPFGQKVIHVVTRRLNALPVLPDPTPPTNDNSVLAGVTIRYNSPAISPDMKTRLYGAVAVYTYHLLTPIWAPKDPIQLPITDVDGYNRVQYLSPSANTFRRGMIEDLPLATAANPVPPVRDYDTFLQTAIPK